MMTNMPELTIVIVSVFIIIFVTHGLASSQYEKNVIIDCAKSGYVVFEKQETKILCSVEKK